MVISNYHRVFKMKRCEHKLTVKFRKKIWHECFIGEKCCKVLGPSLNTLRFRKPVLGTVPQIHFRTNEWTYAFYARPYEGNAHIISLQRTIDVIRATEPWTLHDIYSMEGYLHRHRFMERTNTQCNCLGTSTTRITCLVHITQWPPHTTYRSDHWIGHITKSRFSRSCSMDEIYNLLR